MVQFFAIAFVLALLALGGCTEESLGRPAERPTPIAPQGLRYGFQVDYGNNYQRAFQQVKSAQFGWVKLQVRWADLEAVRGKLDWSYLDQVVGSANDQGLRVLLSVTAAPQWARHPGSQMSGDGPPDDPKLFADFLSGLAMRYRSKVGAYEIWNEQNSNREWAGPNGVNAAEYVALLKAAYGAVKDADRDAVVVTGALTPAGDVPGGSRDDIQYFREMYRTGMSGYFDAVGVHASGFNNAPDLNPRDPEVLSRSGRFHGHRSFYFRNFEFYREVMEELGDADKQLWFTEFGWASGEAGEEWAYARETSEQMQAEYLKRAFQLAKDRGYMGAMFVWNLNFFDEEFAKRAFAVVNPDWSLRPAYNSLAALPK